MERGEYEEVFINSGILISRIKNNTWKPLLRQCMICIGIWYNYFMQGLFFGAPTVMIAQIRREANSTEAVTDQMSSWLSSTPVFSAFPMMLVLPWLFQRIGGKFTYLIVCLLAIISYVIFYISKTLTHVIISQVLLGTSTAATNTFVPIMVTEYTSPKYRGIFLTIKSVSPFWGIWIANIIGTFFHWKNIALVSFVCSFYVITIMFWPESPRWLAMKGRYVESAQAHRWLRGVNVDSEKELAQLITSQKQLRDNVEISGDIHDSWCSLRLSRLWSTIKLRSYHKPAIICLVLLVQYHFTGKLVIAIYAIDVLKNMTKDESIAYKGMLILDGITIFSMYLGCILSRYLRRRILLFSFASIGISCLYILSFYLYLVSLSVINENHFIIIFLLSVFSIGTGCGPMILTSSIYGEIVPARYVRSIMTLAGLGSITIMSVSLKVSPFMFKALKMYGCLLFYATSSTFIVIFLYYNLPETKGKTLIEVNEYFTGKDQSKQQNKKLLQTEELK